MILCMQICIFDGKTGLFFPVIELLKNSVFSYMQNYTSVPKPLAHFKLCEAL